MPKAYVIARVTVTDPDAYAEYAKGATAAIRQYDGRPLVRGGALRGAGGRGAAAQRGDRVRLRWSRRAAIIIQPNIRLRRSTATAPVWRNSSLSKELPMEMGYWIVRVTSKPADGLPVLRRSGP